MVVQYAGITLMATLLKETVSLSTRAVEHLLAQDMVEESRRSPSSSDAGGALHDAIRSAGAGTVTGQQADAAHSSMRQHGHLYEKGLKLDLSQILTAASTVQAEALRASDDRRCCTTILLWITAIILYVAYWFLSED